MIPRFGNFLFLPFHVFAGKFGVRAFSGRRFSARTARLRRAGPISAQRIFLAGGHLRHAFFVDLGAQKRAAALSFAKSEAVGTPLEGALRPHFVSRMFRSSFIFFRAKFVFCKGEKHAD